MTGYKEESELWRKLNVLKDQRIAELEQKVKEKDALMLAHPCEDKDRIERLERKLAEKEQLLEGGRKAIERIEKAMRIAMAIIKDSGVEKPTEGDLAHVMPMVLEDVDELPEPELEEE